MQRSTRHFSLPIIVTLALFVLPIIFSGVFAATNSIALLPVTPPVSPPVTVTPTQPVTPPNPNSTPTPTPTVKPGPKPNHPPVITTTALPRGKVGRWYLGFVEASDPDKHDSIRLNVANLPKGIYAGGCFSNVFTSSTTARCLLWGVPKKAGEFTVHATAKDKAGLVVRRNIPLVISR